MSKTIILSLGGSIIYTKEGLNVSFLKKFKKIVEDRVALGDKFIIVTGGGVLARSSIQSASQIDKNITASNKDWIGIAATHLNAQVVKSVFKDLAHPDLILDPKIKIKTNKSVLLSGGYLPGNSSDYVCVLLAKTYNIEEILNISNIDYIYDKDPSKYKDAQKIENLSWSQFQTIIGGKWEPGLKAPFDPVASKLSQKLDKKVVVVNGSNLNNLKKYLSANKFKGSIIYGK